MGENKKNTILVKNDPYFSGYIRLAIAVVIAVLLIWLSAKMPITQLVLKKRFYYSLSFGFLLAAAVIESIHWVNVLLDKFCSWQVHRKKRLLLQLLIGVAGVLYLDFWLAKGIYHILDKDFYKSGFMQNIMPINALLICIAHVVFYFRRYDSVLFKPNIWYAKLFAKKMPVDLFADAEVMPNQSLNKTYGRIHAAKKCKNIITISPFRLLAGPGLMLAPLYWCVIEGYMQSTKYVFALNEVLSINTGAVYGDIYLKSGRVCNMHYKGKDLTKYLDPAKFIEIRAGVFYALNAIKGARKERANKHLILKQEFKDIIIDTKISRRYYDKFILGFRLYQNQEI